MNGILRPLATLTVASSLMMLACSHEPAGRLEYTEVPSEAEGRPMRYGVYLPKQWDRQTPLPVVLLLHGAGDDEQSADREVVVNAFDQAIASGTIPPFIMVTPNGDRGFWMNWYDGSHRYKDWVLEEVIPQVRETYPTVEGSEGLHLMGVSMGGGGGMQMWLSDPSRFASATIISAPILDEQDTRKFLRRFMPKKGMDRVFGPEGSGRGVDPYSVDGVEDLKSSRLTFGAATSDMGRILDSNEAFHEHLDDNAVPHRFVTFTGHHGWKWWAPMFTYSLCYNLNENCTAPPPDGWQVASVPSPAGRG
jgi:enterochelin esterase-like enzyme